MVYTEGSALLRKALLTFKPVAAHFTRPCTGLGVSLAQPLVSAIVLSTGHARGVISAHLLVSCTDGRLSNGWVAQSSKSHTTKSKTQGPEVVVKRDGDKRQGRYDGAVSDAPWVIHAPKLIIW